MTYRIAADCTYTTQSNRDATLSEAQTLLSGYSYVPVTGRFPAGINTVGTTGLTISVEVATETEARDIGTVLVSVLNATNRKYSKALIAIYRRPD